MTDPGHRGIDTSREVAEMMLQPSIVMRTNVLETIIACDTHGATADEVAEILKLDILNVRPRFTELKVMGVIFDSGIRRKNSKGNTTKVWRHYG